MDDGVAALAAVEEGIILCNRDEAGADDGLSANAVHRSGNNDAAVYPLRSECFVGENDGSGADSLQRLGQGKLAPGCDAVCVDGCYGVCLSLVRDGGRDVQVRADGLYNGGRAVCFVYGIEDARGGIDSVHRPDVVDAIVLPSLLVCIKTCCRHINDIGYLYAGIVVAGGSDGLHEDMIKGRARERHVGE